MMKPVEQLETAVAEVAQTICATCTLADARAGSTSSSPESATRGLA